MNSSDLRVQRVDYAASWLLSAWIVSGLLVIALFFVWWNGSLSPAPQSIIDEFGGQGVDARVVSSDVEPPGNEEAEALTDPSLGDSLAALTDVASGVAATTESESTDSGRGEVGRSQGRLSGADLGGRLGGSEDAVARFERWELQFLAKDVKDYAAQLDFYKIELGCVGKARLVDYATGFSGPIEKRVGKGSEEKRLYFMWRQEGPLVAFDRQLLGQAGIETQGRQLLKFIPPNLEDQLAKAELKHAISQGHDKVREIAKTVFESRPSSAGYDFVVIEQRYRTAQ